MNIKIKEPHEFTPEEAQRLLKALFEHESPSRWGTLKEKLREILDGVVKRHK